MTRTRFEEWPCSVARTVDVIGDAWSLLILREVFYGVRKFDELQSSLDISRNILTRRLATLVERGVLEKRAYQERPARYAYVPTPRGRALFDVLLVMMRFGDDWLSPEGSPVELRSRGDGELIRPIVVDERTRERIDPRGIRAHFGPGFPEEARAEPIASARFAPPVDDASSH